MFSYINPQKPLLSDGNFTKWSSKTSPPIPDNVCNQNFHIFLFVWTFGCLFDCSRFSPPWWVTYPIVLSGGESCTMACGETDHLITWPCTEPLSLQPAQVKPGRTCPDRYHLPFIEGYSICFYHKSVLWMIAMIIADMKTKNIYRALVRKQFTHPPSSNSLYAQFQCQAVFHYTLKSNAKQHSLHCDLFSFFCR